MSKDHDIIPTMMTSINRVRGYLEVFTLADIATGDGTKIRQCFIQGTKCDTTSLWEWHEERPSALDFTNWKWAMTLLIDETKKLHKQLGKRIAKPHHDWIWFYFRQQDVIYKKELHNGLHLSRDNQQHAQIQYILKIIMLQDHLSVYP